MNATHLKSLTVILAVAATPMLASARPLIPISHPIVPAGPILATLTPRTLTLATIPSAVVQQIGHLTFTDPVIDRLNAYIAIMNKAYSLGHDFTGDPVSFLDQVTGGYRVRFQNCDIYYSPATGAHEVHGDIRAKYNAKGGPDSDLRLPVTDETGTPDGIGRYNHFSGNGSIYWTPNTGPMEVRGGIRAYWASGGWEKGPFSYPTTDEQVVGPNQWYSDFKNGVIFFDTNQVVPTVNAGLSADQLTSAVRQFFLANKHDDGLYVDSVSLTNVSDTGYGFWSSRNRLVTFHFSGSHDSGHWYIPNPSYDMDLQLLFYAQKESDGSSSLWVALTHWYIHTSGIGHDDLLHGLENGINGIFASPVKLSSDNIPAFCNLLSFKIMPDGSLTLFLKPGQLAGLCQLLIQRKLDALAGN